jgi:hypothetical protein
MDLTILYIFFVIFATCFDLDGGLLSENSPVSQVPIHTGATMGFSLRFSSVFRKKLSAIHTVSSSSCNLQKPMGMTFGTPSFEAVASGNIPHFGKCVFHNE